MKDGIKLYVGAALSGMMFVLFAALAVKSLVDDNIAGLIYYSLASGIMFATSVYFACCLAVRDEGK